MLDVDAIRRGLAPHRRAQARLAEKKQRELKKQRGDRCKEAA